MLQTKQLFVPYGSGGGGAATSGDTPVAVVDSNVNSAALGNGLRYLPFDKVAVPNSEYFTLSFRSGLDGTATLKITYGMSGSHAGDVSFDTEIAVFNLGDEPAGALADVPQTRTPGTGTVLKEMEIELGAVVEGDVVLATITRRDHVDDTHTGTLRIFSLSVTVE